MATRNEVVHAVGSRYRAVGRAERSLILDEFVELTGNHRKHAIRLLRVTPKPAGGRRGRRRTTYGDAVRAALLALWNLSDRVCSKRLKPMIPQFLPAVIRHGVIDDKDSERCCFGSARRPSTGCSRRTGSQRRQAAVDAPA